MTVTVVTGAASGMGRACVDRLRGTSETLVAVDLAEPHIAGTVGIACDVSKGDDVESLIARVRELGPFRALAHAAGVSPAMGDARRMFEVDLVGTERMLRAFEPLVVPGSATVCFSSIAATRIAASADADLDALMDRPLAEGFLDKVTSLVTDTGYAYALAKRGVVRACARAAVRWGPLNGRVNSVAPGLIDTPMGRFEFEHQPAKWKMLEQVPLGRLGRADEVAAVVAFLLSDDAGFVSGVDLLVDGGIVPGMTLSAS